MSLNYPEIPEINKTKILDGIELNDFQKSYLKSWRKEFRGLDIFPAPQSGWTYIRAIIYIEQMLAGSRFERPELLDHYPGDTGRHALIEQIKFLVERDRRLKFEIKNRKGVRQHYIVIYTDEKGNFLPDDRA